MDVAIQLDQLGQWDSLGKPVGDIEQEGLARSSLPSSLTSWVGIKKSCHYVRALTAMVASHLAKYSPTSVTYALSFGTTNGLSSMALKMVSMASRGSMGSAQSGEGRTALAASKPTAIVCRWVSLDERTLTGVYNGPPTDAT